jgi:branched-chain amino acid transport system ATP-binding protein
MSASGRVLECRDVTVRFGGVLALAEVDFSVDKGAIAALIGPNGAGKTTLLNAITGMVPVYGGTIRFSGKDITHTPAHKRGRAGVVRTFQNLEIFANMTVLENVMTGAHRRLRYSLLAAVLKTPSYFREEKLCVEFSLECLDFVGLAHMRDLPAGELAFGSQRLLELARAIASEPELLLLDEPAAGLNMKETRQLGGLISRIRAERGVTVALVEHDMDLVMSISDEITVLQYGQRLAKGAPAEIQRNPEVVAAYLGVDEEEEAAERAGGRRADA